MKSNSLQRLRTKGLAVAATLNPGTVVIEGADTEYKGAIWVGETEVENRSGGQSVLQSCVAYVAKSDLAEAPTSGLILTHVETGETYEIYQISGHDPKALRWVIRAAMFPGES